MERVVRVQVRKHDVHARKKHEDEEHNHKPVGNWRAGMSKPNRVAKLLLRTARLTSPFTTTISSTFTTSISTSISSTFTTSISTAVSE